MSTQKAPQKRWMASALQTAVADGPALPFQRGLRGGTAERMASICPSGGTCSKALAGQCSTSRGRAA